jgi:hypothetical protein
MHSRSRAIPQRTFLNVRNGLKAVIGFGPQTDLQNLS